MNATPREFAGPTQNHEKWPEHQRIKFKIFDNEVSLVPQKWKPLIGVTKFTLDGSPRWM
jgi:hypothetical protein